MLYLVATPIGNLGDLSQRALDTLRSVNVIAAEDTRVTRKLTSHFEIKTPMVSYHEHSGPVATAALVRRMAEGGESVALVTDAGTPGISDPGVDLVTASIAAGVAVVPIPGPAAFVAALVASGLPCARFVFEGFLPRTRSSRMQKLNALRTEERTIVFYEAPQRAAETLGEVATVFGSERAACLARELTKKFEEFRRGSVSELAASCAADPPRGECVIVVAGLPDGESVRQLEVLRDIEGNDSEQELAPSSPEQTGTAALRGKELIRQLAVELDIPRRELYQMVLKIKAGGGDG